MTPPPVHEHHILARARRAGAILMGLAVGVLLVIAMFELMRSFGDLGAFQYQGY
ncbi:MAG: hypothetical protein KDE00_08360 [Rhodobacteraceae bacterium]|nr:hypothetical protein [Paracoccaceae bacterium]